MADDTADTAAPQDEDNEDYQIFQAIEDSKAQLLDNEMRRQRDRTIAVRKMQSTQQDGATQKDAEQQGGTKEKRPKPATVAPKGIPSSMVVSQAHPEEGIEARFAPGEIQQEAALEEQKALRIAEFEARLPELPPMPTTARLAALDADQRGSSATVAGRLAAGAVGTSGRAAAGAAALPAAGGGQSKKERESESAKLLTGTEVGGQGKEIVLAGTHDSEELQDGESCLYVDTGFYICTCKEFLPQATPEQHFATLGLKRALTRVEWEAFAEAQADSERAKKERRRAKRHGAAAAPECEPPQPEAAATQKQRSSDRDSGAARKRHKRHKSRDADDGDSAQRSSDDERSRERRRRHKSSKSSKSSKKRKHRDRDESDGGVASGHAEEGNARERRRLRREKDRA